jgi:hypothetical protein
VSVRAVIPQISLVHINTTQPRLILVSVDVAGLNHGQAIRPRKYSEILLGQYEIGKVIRVNRKSDQCTISNKIFDFSPKTIKQLRESGYSNSMDL